MASKKPKPKPIPEDDRCHASNEECTGRDGSRHSCPYQSDVNDDDNDDFCDCCPSCSNECADDI